MITAEEFSQAFEQVSRDQMIVLLECWPRQPKFTQHIKQQMMPAVANALGCSLELEYKRIDIVFRPLPGATDNDTQIVAAIEHENNFGGSDSEVRKLRDLAAPLGVLITYVSALGFPVYKGARGRRPSPGWTTPLIRRKLRLHLNASA